MEVLFCRLVGVDGEGGGRGWCVRCVGSQGEESVGL